MAPASDWPTYVINLTERTDRRRVMQRQLDALGWRAEFFPAARPAEKGPYPSIGARGCYASHMGVLRLAVARGHSQVIVLEDDLNFIGDIQRHWQDMLARLAGQNWSMLYPGHTLGDLASPLTALAPGTGVMCTHFLAFRGPAIAFALKKLEEIDRRPPGHSDGGPMHVDGAYSTIRQQNPAFVTYAYTPSLGFQRPSRSDIAEPKWFDRFEALTPAMNLLRRLKKSLPSR